MTSRVREGEFRGLSYSRCNLCPRMCGVDRTKRAGFCGCGAGIKAARAALHNWEEPCISGDRGSGTVFFSGCTLRCRYCQNRKISLGGFGKDISPERLAEIFIELQRKGAHNINLVTATQYIIPVIEALDIAKPELRIPVVYNCGGYERVETVRALKGYIDIFLPDIKYFSPELSRRYSMAADYFETACAAVSEMAVQVGPPVFGKDGLMKSGLIVRHMVLPGQRKDSIKILEWLADNLPRGGFLLSLMSQYTPYATDDEYRELNRRVTSYEYESVVNKAVELELTSGYMQEKSSAQEEYTPPFGLEGI